MGCSTTPKSTRIYDPRNMNELMSLKIGELTLEEAKVRLPAPTQILDRPDGVVWKEQTFKTVQLWIYRNPSDSTKLVSMISFFDGVLANVTYFPKETEGLSSKRKVVEYFPNYVLKENNEQVKRETELIHRRFLESQPYGIRANYEPESSRIGSITWWARVDRQSETSIYQ
jgi:hypothetical protein